MKGSAAVTSELPDEPELKIDLIRGPSEVPSNTRLSEETIARIERRMIHMPWRDDD